MEEDICSQIAGSIRGEVLYNEPLSRHTSLKVGGPADLFVTPADLADLRARFRAQTSQTLEELGERPFAAQHLKAKPL